MLKLAKSYEPHRIWTRIHHELVYAFINTKHPDRTRAHLWTGHTDTDVDMVIATPTNRTDRKKRTLNKQY